MRILTTTASRASSRGSAKPARRRRSSIFSINGAPDDELASRHILFFCRRFSHQRRAPSCERRDGASVSKPVCQTARRGTLIFDDQRALGLLQSGGLLSPFMSRSRLSFAFP